jgi:hypothetical protein
MNEITITIKDHELDKEATIVIPQDLKDRFYQIVGLEPGASMEEAGFVLINLMKEVAIQDVSRQYTKAYHQRLDELQSNFDYIEVVANDVE